MQTMAIDRGQPQGRRGHHSPFQVLASQGLHLCRCLGCGLEGCFTQWALAASTLLNTRDIYPGSMALWRAMESQQSSCRWVHWVPAESTGARLRDRQQDPYQFTTAAFAISHASAHKLLGLPARQPGIAIAGLPGSRCGACLAQQLPVGSASARRASSSRVACVGHAGRLHFELVGGGGGAGSLPPFASLSSALDRAPKVPLFSLARCAAGPGSELPAALCARTHTFTRACAPPSRPAGLPAMLTPGLLASPTCQQRAHTPARLLLQGGGLAAH